MGTYIEPLDLKTIWLNYFLGNQSLFPFAFIIAISFICAYLGISNTVFFVILAISSIIMGVYMGQAWYILILVLIGFFLYKVFSRIFE